jgi:cobalt-zinc-cadmium efflux system membrane fusion protein
VRSEIPNPDGVLKAEMFANFRIVVSAEAAFPCVPAEAVIREGSRAQVWVQSGPQEFQRRDVTLGAEQEGRIQIRSGLRAGEVVVVRGAIFVDNEGKQ